MRFDVTKQNIDDKRIKVTTSFGEYWYMGSLLHREDGPALIKYNGVQQWFIHGFQVHNKHDFQRLTDMSDDDLIMILLKFGDID